MGTIRIIKIPEGDAPLEVRKAWVGLELPCLVQHNESKKVTDVVSGENHAPRSNCWYVPQKKALEILQIDSPEAAQWWFDNGYPDEDPTMFFTFAEDEAEIIDGIVVTAPTVN